MQPFVVSARGKESRMKEGDGGGLRYGNKMKQWEAGRNETKEGGNLSKLQYFICFHQLALLPP
jgi:hypothetical protein